MKLFLDEEKENIMRELPDIASVADHVALTKDDCVLYLIFRIGQDKWEEIDVMELMDEE